MLKQFFKDHGLTLALLLSGLSAFGAGVKEWGEVLQPSFVFGSIGVAGAVLKAAFGPSPTELK